MLEDTQNSAPIAPTLVSGQDVSRQMGQSWRKAGDLTISDYMATADAQNQLNMAKYNNDYNYWLWKQQTAYNSPAEQVKRLKEAGLNPNFNSIEGAGNASSPSPSSGRLQSNYLGAYQSSISAKAQRLNEVNTILAGFNDLVKNIGQGFDMYRTYVSTPDNVDLYRKALTTLMSNKSRSSSVDTMTKEIAFELGTLGKVGYGDYGLTLSPESSAAFGSVLDSTPLGQAVISDYDTRRMGSWLAQARYKNLVSDNAIKEVVKDLKEFELHKLQPKQLEKLENEIDNLFSRTNFIDTQNDMYARIKLGGMLLPFALMLFKSLF